MIVLFSGSDGNVKLIYLQYALLRLTVEKGENVLCDNNFEDKYCIMYYRRATD